MQESHNFLFKTGGRLMVFLLPLFLFISLASAASNLTVGGDSPDAVRVVLGEQGGVSPVFGGGNSSFNQTLADDRYVFKTGDNVTGDLNYMDSNVYFYNGGGFVGAIGSFSIPTLFQILVGQPLAIRPILSTSSFYWNDLGGNASAYFGSSKNDHGIFLNGSSGQVGFNTTNLSQTVNVDGTLSATGNITAPNLCYISGNCGTGANLTNVAFLNNTQTFTQTNNFQYVNATNISITKVDGGTKDYFWVQNTSGFKAFKVYEQSGLNRMQLCNIGRCYTFDPGNGAVDSSGVSLQLNPSSGLIVGVGSVKQSQFLVGNNMGVANVNGIGLITSAPRGNGTILYGGVRMNTAIAPLLQFRNETFAGINLTTIDYNGNYLTANVTPRSNNTFALGTSSTLWQEGWISNISTRRVQFGNGLYAADVNQELTTIYNRTGSAIVTINQTNGATKTINIPHLIQSGSSAYVCIASDGWLYSSTTGCTI